MSASLEQIRQHWDSRAALGETAGTQDLILKQLEQRAILAELPQYFAQWILEVGCGRGEMARLVAETQQAVVVDAVDVSPAMIAAADAEPQYVRRVAFSVADFNSLPMSSRGGTYDIVYTQRCLINLPTWELQKQAIDAIADRLVPGGRFLMCEHSADGLEALNVERDRRGLKTIVAPWHNRYFQDAELETITSLTLLRCVPFSASYYFHSRVLNAIYADAHGLEPDYDAAVNRLDAPCAPRFAQGRLWVWEKR